MFLVFHEIFRLAVLINFVLIKKKECKVGQSCDTRDRYNADAEP